MIRKPKVFKASDGRGWYIHWRCCRGDLKYMPRSFFFGRRYLEAVTIASFHVGQYHSSEPTA